MSRPRINRAAVLTATLVVSVISLGGCSGTSRIVYPIFDVEVSSPPLVSLTREPVTVHVGRFALPVDGQDPTRIGNARTGVSGRYASVRLSEHPSELLARTLETALAGAGIRIVDADAATYSISGGIGRFGVEERHVRDNLESSVAYVRFEAALDDASGARLWSKELESEAVSYPSLDATKLQKRMLQQAIAETVQAMIDDRALWRALGVRPAS
ncbi:MAG: hypothetical protein V3R77_09840 [Candidatus Binatia bacterium]